MRHSMPEEVEIDRATTSLTRIDELNTALTSIRDTLQVKQKETNSVNPLQHTIGNTYRTQTLSIVASPTTSIIPTTTLESTRSTQDRDTIAHSDVCALLNRLFKCSAISLLALDAILTQFGGDIRQIMGDQAVKDLESLRCTKQEELSDVCLNSLTNTATITTEEGMTPSQILSNASSSESSSSSSASVASSSVTTSSVSSHNETSTATCTTSHASVVDTAGLDTKANTVNDSYVALHAKRQALQHNDELNQEMEDQSIPTNSNPNEKIQTRRCDACSDESTPNKPNTNETLVSKQTYRSIKDMQDHNTTGGPRTPRVQITNKSLSNLHSFDAKVDINKPEAKPVMTKKLQNNTAQVIKPISSPTLTKGKGRKKENGDNHRKEQSNNAPNKLGFDTIVVPRSEFDAKMKREREKRLSNKQLQQSKSRQNMSEQSKSRQNMSEQSNSRQNTSESMKSTGKEKHQSSNKSWNSNTDLSHPVSENEDDSDEEEVREVSLEEELDQIQLEMEMQHQNQTPKSKLPPIMIHVNGIEQPCPPEALLTLLKPNNEKLSPSSDMNPADLASERTWDAEWYTTDHPDAQKNEEGERARFAAFNLRIVFEADKTGFQLNKDFAPPLGAIIAGRFKIIDFFGSAAFSSALACEDMVTGRDVCLKVVENNKDYFDQSLDELKILRFLNQQGNPDEHSILRFYEHFYYKEHLFIATELLKDNLYEFQQFVMTNNLQPYFTMARLQRITRQILNALVFIHSRGVMHCDLKPENILIKSFSRCEVKMIDFGASCFFSDRLSTYIQSRSYRAPEVVLGLDYGPNIDLWSLGCILYELFTGHVLFENDAVQCMLARIQAWIEDIPAHMLEKGKNRDMFFTPKGSVYAVKGENVLILKPTRLPLVQRLNSNDDEFNDFILQLLKVDPAERLSAKDALEHPWLHKEYDYSPYQLAL